MTILWYINGVEKHASCIRVREPTDGTVCAPASRPEVGSHGLPDSRLLGPAAANR